MKRIALKNLPVNQNPLHLELFVENIKKSDYNWGRGLDLLFIF